MRLTREDVYKPVKVISGGERAKLAFCIIMLEKSNVILFDEPTNHLDLPSKEILEQAMSDYDGTLIFVSHDRYLLNKVPTKIVEMTKDGFMVFDGNYEYYKQRKEWLKQKKSAEEPAVVQTAKTNSHGGNYRSKEQRRAEAQRKQRISQLRKADRRSGGKDFPVGRRNDQSEVFSDYVLMTEKTTELQNQNNNLEQYYAEWEDLQS